MDIRDLAPLLAEEELVGVDISVLTAFIELARLLQQPIALLQPSFVTSPPERLSINIHGFLEDSLGISGEAIKLLWHHLRDYVWSLEAAGPDKDLCLRRKYIDMLLEHGVPRKLGMLVLIPQI